MGERSLENSPLLSVHLMGGIAVGGARATVSRAIEIYQQVVKTLGKSIIKARIAGSTRRRGDMFDLGSGAQTVGDVDIVVIPRRDRRNGGDSYWRFHHIMREKFKCSETAKVKFTFKVRGVQVDILVASTKSWGAAMMHSTGPVSFNIKCRSRAKKHGFKLNEKGLWLDDECHLSDAVRLIAGVTEKGIFEALEMDPVDPEDRE